MNIGASAAKTPSNTPSSIVISFVKEIIFKYHSLATVILFGSRAREDTLIRTKINYAAFHADEGLKPKTRTGVKSLFYKSLFLQVFLTKALRSFTTLYLLKDWEAL
jgi:hypothetical protein